MSFVPRDEYVPRRGVAMKVITPSPTLRTGVPRDVLVDQEASKFVRQEFVLNKAMTDQAPKLSKVKTFGATEIPWATGNGNVIAPPKPEPRTYRRVIGHRVPEDQLHHFYHSDHVERERHVQQDIMENARNFADNFSPQPRERSHKIHPDTLKPTPQGLACPINGFRGMGQFHRERSTGKAHVPESSYDPLGMRTWGPRITGLKRLPVSNQSSVAHDALRYDDGIPFESTQKVAYPTPHRHEFPQRYGPEHDMQGFRGLGASDLPGPSHGRRHSPRTNADHDYRNNVAAASMAAARERQGYSGGGAPSPSAGQQLAPLAPLSPPKPMPHHQQQQQSSGQFQQPYRSASSLGLASPSHNYGGGGAPRGGRESCPPGLGSSVRFHPVQH